MEPQTRQARGRLAASIARDQREGFVRRVRSGTQRRRPGWLAKSVLVVLGRADGPMSPRQIVSEIAGDQGVAVSIDSVRHTLVHGREAKAGQIVRIGWGKYELRAQP